MKTTSKTEVVPIAERLPRYGQWVIVVTRSFRCMGYFHADETWRDVNRHEVIKDVQGWCPLNGPE